MFPCGDERGGDPVARAECLERPGWRWAPIPGGYDCIRPAPEVPPTPEACDALGGIPVGYDTYVTCNLPTEDAFRRCCDGSGCQSLICDGFDMYEVGARATGGCSPETYPGCWQAIEAGIASATMCI